ncbi:MAG: electron transfer flavoprotein subunit beta/FixA family protein [Deltaproteobacteria bacterium]|nr:electron transfer flavoprotein subunit beta/FixA family protein [Deltaproteobacteria bacterium]MBW2362588.1 electron transfer flavoprotein subunit beta/FixA family protein [Deltaproteobacteria bacterium]
MRIVVCVKEVLDPDAVNNYALAGRLEIGDDGKTLTQTTIPQLMNGFDEQAIEAALLLRDAGAECTICVVSVGADPANQLRHASALGADEVVGISSPVAEPDAHVVASLLVAHIRSLGGADLVLCGRQASDDDQGVVPALIGEALGMPVVTVASSVELADTSALRVTRVTPDGDEIVEAAMPAVVTISNEIGDPRYPTAANKLKARRVKPTLVGPDDLSLDADALAPRVLLTQQFVPTVQGNCEFISGDTPAELADRLVARLREDKVLP